MLTLTALPFDPTKYVAIAVPDFMRIHRVSDTEIVVEGPFPDRGTWKVDRHVKITFYAKDDQLVSYCKKAERWTYGPSATQAGKLRSAASRCRTDWILRALASGAI